MQFPKIRMRRLRQKDYLRDILREVSLTTNDLIYPIFIIHGQGIKSQVSSMPGVYQLSLDKLVFEVEKILKLGIKSIILFGIPENKDSVGSGAYAEDGIIQQAVYLIKQYFPEIVLITDVCLCEYTNHGHCGLIENGKVLNDSTLELLAKTAITHAQAGADVVAPSDMMDGRVAAIREALDKADLADILIMSYSAKYASAFYGPFRDAADSTPQFGNRNTYQMDPRASIKQAIMETTLDIKEGADIVIVKPAMAYMDIVKSIKDEFLCPVVSYNVSGEYAMLKAAANNGWIDEKKIVLELMHNLKRAGSDLIITYHALDIARWLQEV